MGAVAGEAAELRAAGANPRPKDGQTRWCDWFDTDDRTDVYEQVVNLGVYGKVEYSQARGQHWRATITVAGIGGHSDDFLGQYRRNSHVALLLRYSF